MALPGARGGGAARREAEARARRTRTEHEPGPGADKREAEEQDQAKTQARYERREKKRKAREAARKRAVEARAVRRLERKVRGPTFWSLFEPIPKHPRKVAKGQAILILVLNAFPLPGLGTVLYGKWERGLAQFLLTFLFLIGWVWAVVDGVIIVKNAFASEDDRPNKGAPPSVHGHGREPRI